MVTINPMKWLGRKVFLSAEDRDRLDVTRMQIILTGAPDCCIYIKGLALIIHAPGVLDEDHIVVSWVAPWDCKVTHALMESENLLWKWEGPRRLFKGDLLKLTFHI